LAFSGTITLIAADQLLSNLFLKQAHPKMFLNGKIADSYVNLFFFSRIQMAYNWIISEIKAERLKDF